MFIFGMVLTTLSLICAPLPCHSAIELFSVNAYSDFSTNDLILIDLETHSISYFTYDEEFTPPSDEWDILLGNGHASGENGTELFGADFSLARLGVNVGVGEDLTTSYPGSSFTSFGYFNAWPTPSSGFLAFRTSLDLDSNPETTGDHYGFIDLAVGSITVNGFGFNSTPGETISTTAERHN